MFFAACILFGVLFMFQRDSYKVKAKERVRTQNPYTLLALSFLLAMLLGTALLSLPFAAADGETTDLVDAAFTAVSCVSVTGLATVDTYRHWSLFGQSVMVLLIQLGGLGIMTSTTLLALVFGQHIGLQRRLLLRDDMGNGSMRGLLRITKHVAFLIFAVEAAGAAVYIVALYPYLGTAAIRSGIYQAVSTFCNAGFVFFDNDLPYAMAGDVLFSLTTSVLIMLGGFGYMAIFELWDTGRRYGVKAVSVNTKIMLLGTACLVIGGTVLILILEWGNGATLGPLDTGHKVVASFLQAVTPRTAGVATLDYGAMRPAMLFLTVMLMFIGAGPNSTGGGIKITTAAVMLAAARSIFSNKADVELLERRIAEVQVRRAFSIFFLSLFLVLTAVFLLTLYEPATFLQLLFETTSAFGTVGLTTGITPTLQPLSKWILIFVMYTGRIGVLTLVGIVALKRQGPEPIRYPESDILL